MLPPPANLAGNQHHCVLALLHHPDDQYTSTITNTDNNSRQERKAAHKNLHVVQFTGTLPAAPIMIPFRIHNAEIEQEMGADVLLSLDGYPGRGRLYSLPLKTAQPLEEAVHGLKIDQDFEPFKKWAEEHMSMIRENLESDKPYDREWSLGRMEDMESALESGLMFQIAEGTQEAHLRGVQMEPDSHHTFFLALDPPQEGQFGQNYVIDIQQTGEDQQEVAGGLTVRVELVEAPVVEAYKLELWQKRWLFGYTILRALLYNPAGRLLTPDDGAAARLLILQSDRWLEVPMGWHRSWRSFYHFTRSRGISQVIATGLVNGSKVIEEQLGSPEIEAMAEAANFLTQRTQRETTKDTK
jgi:hypothetical protein